jgi:homoserine kinase type II
LALLTRLSANAAREVARAFGLELGSIEPLEAGSVNSNFVLTARDGRVLFARIYEEQGAEGAARELALARDLSRRGIPVAVPLERPGGALLAEYAGKPFAIFEWIDGEILCQARVTEQACRRVGDALARVHQATPHVAAVGGGRFRVADLEQRIDRVERDAAEELRPAARALLPRLLHYASLRDASLPRGLIHGDLFRDNVLWRGDEIAALLDFESASEGPYAYDVAVTIHAWCFGSAFDPSLVRALLEGYHARRPFETRELAAFKIEAALAALRFAVTRITDYSMRAPPGAAPVRDYQRFVARLAAVEAGAFDEALAAVRV